MTARRHGLTVAIVTLVCLGVTSCTPAGPSQSELTAASEEMHDAVRTVAEEAVAGFEDLNPDLTFTLEPAAVEGYESWADCSSAPAVDADNPDAIVWMADRRLQIEPTQPPAALLSGVADRFATDGWTITDEPGTDASTVKLTRDGYQIRLAAHDPTDTAPARVALRVISPCIDAPDLTRGDDG